MTNNTTISVDLGKDVTYELMIERLGGYEKMSKYVKETLADLENDVPYDTDCYQFETEISFQFGQLQKALLEYRRAHNIFEVGDYVIPNSDHSNEVHFLSEWYIDGLDFRYKTSSGGWGIIVKSCMDTAWRHATDEEIKANRRLDQ